MIKVVFSVKPIPEHLFKRMSALTDKADRNRRMEAKNEKLIQALARHELAVNNLAAASGAIGSELAKCPTQVELDREYDLQWRGGGYSKIEELTDSKGNAKTHLWHAFNYGGERLYDDEVTEYLADEETGCAHCARAWELIQDRKKARQELGIARRLIRYYGKLAMRMVEADE